MQRGVGQVGVDCGGTIAQQHREVVRVAHGGGLGDDVGVSAQLGADQRMVHGPNGQYRRNRTAFRVNAAVGQHEHHGAAAHGLDRVLGQGLHGVLQRAGMDVVVEVHAFDAEGILGLVAQLAELGLGQHRGVGHQTVGVVRGLLEQVLLAAEAGLQRHHDALAERVDRRVGDLGKLLAEVVEQRTGVAGEHRERRVVAHGADGLLAGLGQHAQDLVALLERYVEKLFVGFQALRGHRLAGEQLGVVQLALHMLHLRTQPLAVGLAGAVDAVDVLGLQQFAGFGVHGQHLAGLQAALGDHVPGGVVIHADLRGQCDVSVLRDHVARRAQAVAVQGAGGVAAVGQHDAGRAVPGLHVHGVVFVERAQVGVHVRDVLPRRRDQQAHRAEQVHAAGQQHLQHVVQALRVGALQVHQRFQLGQLGQLLGGELVLARDRPVAVALHGVDFAVVGEEAERLRQAPLREGVGGESLVEHADRGRQFRALQVRVEHRQVGRHHQALVGDYVRRQAGHVEHRVIVHLDLGPAAHHKQRALEVGRAHVRRRIDEHLQDVRLALHRLGAAGVFRIDRHLAPAGKPERAALDGALHGGAGLGDPGRVDEHDAGGEALGQLDVRLGGEGAQEGLGGLHQEPAAVAGLAVGGDRAAVGHAFQGLDRGVDHPVAGYAVHVRDQAEAAVVALEFGAVEGAVHLVLSHRSTPVAARGAIRGRGTLVRAVPGKKNTEKGAGI